MRGRVWECLKLCEGVPGRVLASGRGLLGGSESVRWVSWEGCEEVRERVWEGLKRCAEVPRRV